MSALLLEDNWSLPLQAPHGVGDRSSKEKLDLICDKHKAQSIHKQSVIVHIIDGYIIEESNLPFKGDDEDSEVEDEATTQASAPAISDPDPQKSSEDLHVKDSFSAPHQDDRDELMSLLPMTCKYCRGPLPEDRAMWGKRFCSVSCSKRYSVNCSQRVRRALQQKRSQQAQIAQGKGETASVASPTRGAAGNRGRGVKRGHRLSFSGVSQLDGSTRKGASVHESPASSVAPGFNQSASESVAFHTPISNLLDLPEIRFTFPPRFPLGFGLEDDDVEDELYDGVEPLSKYACVPMVAWSVRQVADYISSIPGCASYASRFEAEEIDGKALMLLKEDHMVHEMNLKLGPALKIAAQLRSIKLSHGLSCRTKYLSSPV